MQREGPLDGGPTRELHQLRSAGEARRLGRHAGAGEEAAAIAQDGGRVKRILEHVAGALIPLGLAGLAFAMCAAIWTHGELDYKWVAPGLGLLCAGAIAGVISLILEDLSF